MLLGTLFSMHMRPLVDAGMVYIAISPLYRVIRNNTNPVYLEDESELNDYIVKELEEHYEFRSDAGKKMKASCQSEYVRLIRLYINKLKEISDKYCTSPVKFEAVVLENPELDLPETTEVNFNEKANKVEIKGFYSTEYEDLFIYLNADIDELTDDIDFLLSIYNRLKKFSNIVDKKGNPVFEQFGHSVYLKLNKLFDGIRSSMTITRFKGLGECEPDELWDSSINPETRKLVRVTIPEGTTDEELQETIANFMSSKTRYVEFRKQLILDHFDNIAKQKLEEETL